jgi:hypothetical protein
MSARLGETATELGYVARIKPEFDKRNVKVIGLSVDSVESLNKWESDIAETRRRRHQRRRSLKGRCKKFSTAKVSVCAEA